MNVSYKPHKGNFFHYGIVSTIKGGMNVGLLVTALTGYLLPWGQLSYWGMVVTAEIPTAIDSAPIIGKLKIG